MPKCFRIGPLLLILGVFIEPLVRSFNPSPSSSINGLPPRCPSKTSLYGLPMPFFATSSATEQVKEGRASITTRLPIGKLFDSREYIFSTASNVRGFEWGLKETEEMLDDFLDASLGVFAGQSESSTVSEGLSRQDYELSQIVLVPMDWDRDLYGLGGRYDVHDGQQRLATLCLIFAAMRESFLTIEGMEETASELSNMLNPPKTRKEQVLRIEMNKRDDEILSNILKGDMDKVSKIKTSSRFFKMSKPNQQILENFEYLHSRTLALDKDELLTLLDFMIENIYLLVCVPESAAIARNIVMGQTKGKNVEAIDDFKGLVCFRYTQDEKTMFKTFDAWDNLASSVVDIDAGAVGRDTVADACVLRASAILGRKIATRKQLFWLEQWMRDDIIEEQYQGDGFFKNKVLPASLALGQFRAGPTPSFGFSKGGKIIKASPSIQSQLDFLRELIKSVPASKDIEMIVLELLLRAWGSTGKSMPLKELEQYLLQAEILSLYFSLVKPTAAKKYAKCFALLDAIESGKIGSLGLLGDAEKVQVRDALSFNSLGATAGGKRLATSLLKRLNRDAMIKNGQDIIGTGEQVFLEPVLPVKATKKAWGEYWPEKEKQSEWVYTLGNLSLVTQKVATREMKLSFPDKKDRYKSQIWPLTAELGDNTVWDEAQLKENGSKMVRLVESIWWRS